MATRERSDRGPTVPPEPAPGPAATTATDKPAWCRCRTTTRAGQPRQRGTSTAARPRATDSRRARGENGDPARTSPSPADAAVVGEPERVFGSCLGLLEQPE